MKQDVEGEHDEVEWRECVQKKVCLVRSCYCTPGIEIESTWCGVVLGKRTDTGTIDGRCERGATVSASAAVLGFWASVKSARRETRREKRRKQYPGSRRTRGRE